VGNGDGNKSHPGTPLIVGALTGSQHREMGWSDKGERGGPSPPGGPPRRFASVTVETTEILDAVRAIG